MFFLIYKYSIFIAYLAYLSLDFKPLQKYFLTKVYWASQCLCKTLIYIVQMSQMEDDRSRYGVKLCL